MDSQSSAAHESCDGTGAPAAHVLPQTRPRPSQYSIFSGMLPPMIVRQIRR
jgi:hypothetical protein